MKKSQTHKLRLAGFFLFMAIVMIPGVVYPQNGANSTETDKKVRAFMDRHKGDWHNMNVPREDGQLLYDLIIKNDYKRALEIGTSTGYSSIWIAWALSKTGGKLITIEVDKERYEQAIKNFREAGLTDYIDARLADAHELVPKLKGPFDFVFCDADKRWYKNYFMELEDNLVPGACFTAHNTNMYGVIDYLHYVRSLPGYKTTIDNRGAGMGITYKLEKDFKQ